MVSKSQDSPERTEMLHGTLKLSLSSQMIWALRIGAEMIGEKVQVGTEWASSVVSSIFKQRARENCPPPTITNITEKHLCKLQMPKPRASLRTPLKRNTVNFIVSNS